MEFFELGIERIHRLISDCFLLAAARGLLFAFLFLIAGALVVFFCHRRNFFKRKNRAMQFVARSYYFYIPLVFLLCGFAIGAALATKDFFAKETKNSISPLMKLVFPAYQSHVNTHWDRVIQTRMSFTQTLEEYVHEIKFEPRSGDFKERFSTHTANLMVPKITRWGIESVVNTARDMALKQSEEQGYIENNKVKALLIVHSLSMFNYPPGLWDETNTRLEEKLAYFFEGVAGNIFLVFLLLLLFPFIETALHQLYFKRKIRLPAAPAISENGEIHQNGYQRQGEIVEQFERIPREKAPAVTVDIEIPRVFEN